MMSVSSKMPFPSSGCSFGTIFRISSITPTIAYTAFTPFSGFDEWQLTPPVSTTTSARPRWPILTLVEVASPTMTKSGWMRFVISRGATPSKHSSCTEPETQIVPAKSFFVCAAKRPAAMTIAQSLPFMSEVPRP